MVMWVRSLARLGDQMSIRGCRIGELPGTSALRQASLAAKTTWTAS